MTCLFDGTIATAQKPPLVFERKKAQHHFCWASSNITAQAFHPH
jgi:hypothetical protein